MDSNNTVSTRILLLSDTHSCDLASIQLPSEQVDVAVHCGDLTEGSSLEEFQSALRLLKAINAPLKLVIPGNHDFTMDADAFAAIVGESVTPLEPELVASTYGEVGQAAALIQSAHQENIVLLEEGTHEFRLNNGAALKVYASPYTSSLGNWGFQYHPNKVHPFDILPGTDIVITHGPPQGIMDRTRDGKRAGCPQLFTAVVQSRPRLHCFGHIHEGWGARLVTWKDVDNPTHFNSIDNDRSIWVAKLSSLTDLGSSAPGNSKEGCFTTSHCRDDPLPICRGESTLFVNASVCDGDGIPNQKLWMIDLDLERCQSSAQG